MSATALPRQPDPLPSDDTGWADLDVLVQLRSWADAIARVRAMGITLRPLDPDRYWHYFSCTD